ncbi:propionyl-CoA carboxylase-like protein [Phyllosticta citriasiana]|uniref:Propionyl-CoA carboxylase beta chain, mitochondrial n=1 Tax=Phyllosticta citriasiana TaxID=595635 RepID=A0ABR1KNR7_9PEZI
MTGNDDAGGSSAQSSASRRLAQVSSHLTQSTKFQDENARFPSSPSSEEKPARRRRKARKQSSVPADYSDVLSNISTLRDMASKPTHRGYTRQKQAGKLWVRDRVDQLLDPDSFKEVGSVSGTVEWRQVDGEREEPVSFVPSNNVQGFGLVGGRKVVLTADDFSLRAGHADGALAAKTLYMEKLAVALQLPMIKLVDGSSGGGSVTTIIEEGHSYVPPLIGFDSVVQQLNMGIPNLGAVLGPAIGLGAARVTACHFSVMAADVGSLFNAGPKVVAKATFEEGLSPRQLGGPGMHCTNGTIDNLAANESECFEQLRTVLGYLPSSGTQLPPVIASSDPLNRQSPSLRTAIPRARSRAYNPLPIITTLVDASSFFQIGPHWGRTAIAGLARFGGHPIGILAMNPVVNSGALDAAGSQKLTRHLKFCDVFNLPVVQLIDVPGYAVGTAAERSATMRHGVALATAYYATSVPIFSVLVRRVYGVAGAVMVDGRDPHHRVAWPSGEWGSLPLDGGIEVGHAQELRDVLAARGQEARDARYAELEQQYRRLMNPVRTANAFGVEEIIDPAVTRQVVGEWVKHMYEVLLPERVQKRMVGTLSPRFT